jgi:enoyl-CoA hydratase/carnithine racemase
MQCDIRLVAREAKLAFAHVRRGVLPDAHSHWTVPRAIGFARTADLFLTGRTITGDEAAAMGLASRVLPASEVLPAALAIADDVARNTAPCPSRCRSASSGRAARSTATRSAAARPRTTTS